MRSVCLLSVVAVLACTTQGALACGAYTIQPGDTFWKISQKRGFSVDAILAANPGVVPEALQIGQTVNLPCNGGGNNGGNRPQPQPQPQQPNGGSASGSVCNAMLPHVNAARGQAGLNPLRCSGELDRAAQRHSDDQARRDKIGHTGSDGSDIGDRINPMVNAMGCRKRGGISENVAQNRPGSSAKTYFDQWMGSAGHKQNILGRDATHMGVAVAGNGRKEYATQVFAECR